MFYPAQAQAVPEDQAVLEDQALPQAVPVKVIQVIMTGHPDEIREDCGLETVYKHPSVQVLSVVPEDEYTYLVTLCIPLSCYEEVLTILQKEPFIIHIDGVASTPAPRRPR